MSTILSEDRALSETSSPSRVQRTPSSTWIVSPFLLAALVGCGTQRAIIGETGEAVENDPSGGETATSASTTETNPGASGGAAATATGTPAHADAGIMNAANTDPPPATPCANETTIELSPAIVAERLSQLLFAEPVSPSLLDLAASGDLDTFGEVECQALDMIEDARVSRGLNSLLESWLGLGTWELEPAAALSDELWQDMQAEATQFLVDFAASDDTRIDGLFANSSSRVTAALAEHYGVEFPEGETTAYVNVPGRPGLLGLGLVTASLNRIGERGDWTISNVLCTDVGAPLDVPPAPTLAGQSYRESWEELVSTPSCTGCHVVLDGPGFALEQFDELGRPRSEEAGQPIDTSGALVDATDGDTELRPFTDAADFARLLTDSRLLADCVAYRALQITTGEGNGPLSGEATAAERMLSETLDAHDRDLRFLLVGLTQTGEFWSE